MIRRIFLASLLLVTAACTATPGGDRREAGFGHSLNYSLNRYYELEDVRAMTPQGDAFQTALREEYLTLAAAERAEADWLDTEEFVDRARRSTQGELVLPEALEVRGIEPAKGGDLALSRGQLLRAFDLDGRRIAPQLLARAQAMFDCWMQEAEENIQPDDIEACRSQFEIAFAGAMAKINSGDLVILLPDADGRLGTVIVRSAGGEQVLSGTANVATRIFSEGSTPAETFRVEDDELQKTFSSAIDAQPEPPEVYTLYFRFESTRMTAESRGEFDRILDAIAARGVPADIDVIGHTDRSGDLPYNIELSLRRAIAIRKRLQGADVPFHSIGVYGHGENNPLIPTEDGAYEPENRRVDVNIR